MTLTEFLWARIAEDERQARATEQAMASCEWDEGDPGVPAVERGVARILAECEAKRRIVEIATRPEHQSFTDPMVDVLMALALPYADHPDYHPERRPPAIQPAEPSNRRCNCLKGLPPRGMGYRAAPPCPLHREGV